MKVEWKTCFKIGVSLFLLYLGILYWQDAVGLVTLFISAASPLFIGCAVAYVVNILMSFYEKHYFTKNKNTWVVKSKRPVCMVAAFATVVAVIFLVIWMILPQLTSCVQVILAGVPGVLEDLVELIDEHDLLPENILASLENINWQSKINQIVQVVTSGIGSVANVLINTVSAVFSWVVSALLSLIFAIYILSGKETIGNQFDRLFRRYLKDGMVQKIYYVLGIVDDCFHKFIVGQCTEAVILGILCALGMVILRLPYATMIGALMAFTALIPVAGAWIGGVVGAVMILTVSPIQAVIFVIYIVVLQQLETNLIYPRVVGSSMGLPGLWVLAAVTVGGGVLGVGGMLIGVPLAAAVYQLLRNDVKKIAIKK